MKKILIYDVAAESGGALTVLDKFYAEYCNKEEYECYFVVSVLSYEENDRIHVIKLPWVKKSWFHRLYCDYVYMKKFIKDNEIDEVLSLQNIGIPNIKIPQTVYVHNAIPFTEHKFSLFKEPLLWIYQNIIGRLTRKSLKAVDKIIVQTDWMKKEIEKQCKVQPDRVVVKEVKVEDTVCTERESTDHTIFFYPTSPIAHKNNEMIIEACKLLKKCNVSDYEVVLTLSGNENKLAEKLQKEASKFDLPIKFVGRLNKEQMNEFYNKSVLVFPSYLETVGLPLLEAKSFGARILASDCLYAHCVLKDYPVCWFDPYDAESISSCMRAEIGSNKIERDD